MGANSTEPRDRLEWVLGPLFKRFQVYDFRGGRIFHGPVSPYCEAHRREVEAGLKQLPGGYAFERVAGTTYLTCTMPGPDAKGVNVLLHVLLFAATVLTTLVAGASWQVDGFVGQLSASLAGAPGSRPVSEALEILVTQGGPFSLALLLILGTHECGHYFMARRYGMLVTPPFFLPAPFPPVGIGTFGALIRVRSPWLHRRALLDIGVAGPLAGFAVALPFLIYGLLHSNFEVIRYWKPGGGMYFGNSLLTWGLTRLLVGPTPPGYALDWLSHPFGWAGWIGMLVTALNLIPVGQLDGSHVAYALVGRRQRGVAYFVLGVLLALTKRWFGWTVWCVVMVTLLRVTHPPVAFEDVPLGAGRRAIGWAAMVLLLLLFMPAPVGTAF